MYNVAILDDYQGVALALGPWQRLDGRCRIQVFRQTLDSEDELVSRLAGFDIIVANRERTAFPGSVLRRLPNLRLIATSGRRNAAIDVSAAKKQGILVVGTETLTYPTVELTWALILGWARRLVAESGSLQAGGWQTTVGIGLQGKVLGVVGMGRLGSEVARIGAAFGMRVLGWSRNLTPERATASSATAVSFDQLLRSSDVLTLHVPLNPQTAGLIGVEELARMRPNALLVNTARGQVIDEAALAEALKARRIGGAALDVYREEPLPRDSPLRTCPNVLLSPHLGYVVEDNYRLAFEQSVENIEAWLAGAPIRVIDAPLSS